MPEISVIVPIYKVEPYLARCVDGILAQSFTDFELILVDDGSPDNCGAICDEYARKDSRVHVIHQENSGLSAARNAGIDWAFVNGNSQWLTFIDSDDWVHLKYLETLYNMAVESNVSVSICAYQESNGITQIEDNKQNCVTLWKTEDFFVQHHVNATVAWGKLYKKECFREIRYPVGKLHEDEFVTYRILFELPSVVATDVQLYYYFQNQNGIMRSEWTPERLVAIEAYKEQIVYFNSKDFPMAKMCSARSYVGALCGWLKVIREAKSVTAQIPKTEKEVLTLLRKALKEYRKEVPFNECRWAYVVAYPRFTKFCGLTERVIGGIWRKIHG